MKNRKILLFGEVFDASQDSIDLTKQAQEALTKLIGNNLSVVVNNTKQDIISVRVYRQYPPESQIDFNQDGIPLNDCRILAGDYGQKVIDFGHLPYADIMNYYLTDADVMDSFNQSADTLGFTEIKSMDWTCTEKYFDVELLY